eukprot:Gb_40006 [translate_table: standard]
MGGESSMSTVESGLEVPTGSENELLRIRGAQLCLIDGEESVIIQSGDFAFHVIKQTESPLAATVGLVGDFQWPVGKDSPALKVGNKKYAFALPGLVYGLVLPANTPVEAVQSLEGLLQQYSTFEQYPEISDGAENNEQGWLVQARQEVAEYWTSVAPQVEKISTQMARRMPTAGSSSPPCSDMECVAPSPPVQKTSKALGDLSPRMMKRIQQARRMSAVAKLLSKTLLRGAINANRHVAGGGRGDSTLSPPFLNSNSQERFMGLAFANVDAFAKVVEAVETAGRSLLEVASSVGSEFQQQSKSMDHSDQQPKSLNQNYNYNNNNNNDSSDCFWTLNKSGLRLLLRATAASAVIHVARGIGASSFSSSQSSPQSGLSQQGSIPSPLDEQKEKCSVYDHKRLHTTQFIPTPNSDAIGHSNESVCSASGSARPPASTRPHRSNSPFQQYSRPMDQAASTLSPFHFALGIDKQSSRQHQNM